jgi:DNA repair exonuclease SbcCD ATPase subunit
MKSQYTDIGENVYYARIYISKIEELKEKVMRYMENYEELRKQFQKIQTNTKSNVRKDQIQAVNATYNELRDILIILQRDLTTQNISDQEIYETLHTNYDQYDELLKQLWPYREPSFKEKMKKTFTRRNSNVVIGNLPSPYIPKDSAGNPKEINQDHLRLLNEVQELYNQRRSEFQRIKDTGVIYPKNLEHIIIQYRVMLDQIGSTLYKNKKIGDTFQNYLTNDIQPVLQGIIPPIFQNLERFYELSTEAKTYINTSVLFQAIYRDNLQEIERIENSIQKMNYPYKNKKGEPVFRIDYINKYIKKMNTDLNDILNTMNTIHHRVFPPPPPPATTTGPPPPPQATTTGSSPPPATTVAPQPKKPMPKTREEALLALGYQVTDTPTDKEISKKFRVLSTPHHPNRGGDQEEFKFLGRARDILLQHGGGRKKTRRNRKTASKKKSRKQGRK